MENILTIAGLSQVMLSLFAHDRFATAPALVLGIMVFGGLVLTVRQVLKEDAPVAPRRPGVPRKLARVL